ncbi:MAG: HAD family hydrolase [Thaumarchaeota archaeon]|nr:HAD family hydrolase [Nitrososphaerota archaeon]MDE0266242.1 HAD family hydrolase [Nitrososphaerota archaeon]MDE0527046.1 HAD family hydrolase [Nitrososphaerota archaeon]
MEILLKTYKARQESVVASLGRSRKLHPGIKRIETYQDTEGDYYVVVHHNKLRLSETKHKSITEWLNKMKYVRCATIVETVPNNFQTNYKNRDCRFIFDIDSTLTHGRPGIIARETKSILGLLKSKGHWIHFATGRREGDVFRMIRYCRTEPEGIAENGGLIILDGRTEVFGNREEPDAAFWCLVGRYGTRVKQDMQQGSRRTERIIDNTLRKQEYEKCTKKYNVDILASKSSYHIVAKDINKGTALRKLIDDRGWNNDYIVCVGDSDLDVPMFQEADASFAVRSSSALAKKHASYVLANDFEQGVKEMVTVWFN